VETYRNLITFTSRTECGCVQFLGMNELTGIELMKRLGLTSWSVQLLPPTLRHSTDSFLK
jgi:hypothetical protein